MAAIGVAALTAFLIGVPTAIVHTPLFMRMLPTTWWDYPVWVVAAVLVGLTAATYVRSTNPAPETQESVRRTLAATVLSGLAVGCPICNKLVVMLLGVSGALNVWAPMQPLLGVISLALLLLGLLVRLRGEVACSRPTG